MYRGYEPYLSSRSSSSFSLFGYCSKVTPPSLSLICIAKSSLWIDLILRSCNALKFRTTTLSESLRESSAAFSYDCSTFVKSRSNPGRLLSSFFGASMAIWNFRNKSLKWGFPASWVYSVSVDPEVFFFFRTVCIGVTKARLRGCVQLGCDW